MCAKNTFKFVKVIHEKLYIFLPGHGVYVNGSLYVILLRDRRGGEIEGDGKGRRRKGPKGREKEPPFQNVCVRACAS